MFQQILGVDSYKRFTDKIAKLDKVIDDSYDSDLNKYFDTAKWAWNSLMSAVEWLWDKIRKKLAPEQFKEPTRESCVDIRDLYSKEKIEAFMLMTTDKEVDTIREW